MSELRRLFRYVKPYWLRMSAAAVALVISSLIALALPMAIRYLVDSVFLNQDYAQLNAITVGLFALFAVQGVISFVHRYLMDYIAQRVVADLRLDIHRHLLHLPLRFYSSHRTGELVSRVSNDASMIQGALTDAPVSLLRQLVTFVGGIVLMLMMNWQLTAVILLLIPPLVLFSTIYGRRLKLISTNVQDKLADSTTVLEETLSGIRVVKSFAREPFEQARYGDFIEETFAVTMERTRVRSVFVPVVAFLSFSAMTILLWFGGRQVIAGVITPGELVAFLFYMIVVSSPMAEAAGLYARIQEAMGAARRIFDILDSPTELQDAPPPQPELIGAELIGAELTGAELTGAAKTAAGNLGESELAGRVHIAQVAFTYAAEDEEGATVLHDINLTAEPGQIVALVGYSGSGKTTLVNLIPRFYDPSAGVITLDGHDIRTMALPALRSHIALVPQETFLFGGTIRENIIYGRLDATDAAIRAAAEAAFAHEFIAELPDRYETVVGERGIKLSAGQRQRIAIARALLKNPRILILDEATSALDSESERWVQAALDRLMEGRTSFVIAHRLSTIHRADQILVMSKGAIVERGTHDTLLTAGGLYQRLHDLQFTTAEPETHQP